MKIKPFDTYLGWTMFNLANSRVDLKFNKSVLMQKGFSSMYISFVLNLYIAFKLNVWPRKPANNFTLKIVHLVQLN